VPERRELLSRPWWLLPPVPLHPVWWVAVAAILLGLDFAFHIDTQFPTFYALPVMLAAWYSGRGPAVALAIALPLAHAALLFARATPGASLATLQGAFAATALRGSVVLLIALWFDRFAEHERALERHVRTLEGLLPICMHCKNIRNEMGEWERLEAYIGTRSEATFSHGLCPSCQTRYYGKYFDGSPSA
jgi:hypothetical protein